ncbi:ADP-ribosylglycohydrolase family protein [Streptomyces sp. NPDC002133]|uniref:ADP-ribosylglycohydrolase family protein n=1 Tax=Streptomyces sp. NPDC002133 TaxID=3154409 RepID=UPI0033167517
MTDRNKHQDKVLRGHTASGLRGMLIGMALGESMGAARGALPDTGPLRAGVCTQLACFTAEGSIRALVRSEHKGICHPPSVLWHAYSRWATLQGIEADRMRARWGESKGDAWPDGWLAQVPALAERRGSAPATVQALSAIEQGTVDKPTTASRGWHAVGRTLPLAGLGTAEAVRQWDKHARDIAALTHGDPTAQSAAAHATVLTRHCLTGDAVRDALKAGLSTLHTTDGTIADAEHARIATALAEAVEHPADPARLARLAPDATAPSALLGGLYTAASFPDHADVHAALRFAAAAPDGESVACVTGAVLGATHGIEALPLNLVSRHELTWVLDTLARDLLAEVSDAPSGSEYVQGWDPHWWSRYPGW